MEQQTMTQRVPRGIRNNNPGNIRKTPTKWKGEVGGIDPEFETFSTPELGIRAMAKLLVNYQTRHGLDTIEEIVGRWAPPIENDTSSYIDSVAKATNISKFRVLNLSDEDTLLRIIKAIITHENGYNPYTDAQIRIGIGQAYNS